MHSLAHNSTYTSQRSSTTKKPQNPFCFQSKSGFLTPFPKGPKSSQAKQKNPKSEGETVSQDPSNVGSSRACSGHTGGQRLNARSQSRISCQGALHLALTLLICTSAAPAFLPMNAWHSPRKSQPCRKKQAARNFCKKHSL